MCMCLISAEYPSGLIIPVDNYLGKRIILEVGTGVYGNLIYNYSVFNSDNQCTSGGGGGGGSKSRPEDVKELINDLYTKNFIEEASDSFITSNLSDGDFDSDLDVYFLDEVKKVTNIGGESKDQSMEEP